MASVVSTLSPGLAKDYDKNKSYHEGNFVLHHNSYWKCRADIGPETWNEEHWEEIEEPMQAKADLENGKVPYEQLPEMLNDVLEYGTLGNFPVDGTSGKIYVAKDTGKIYRRDDDTSEYVEISQSDVVSVNGKDGEVALTAGDIGYDDVGSGEDTVKSVLDDTYRKDEVDALVQSNASHYRGYYATWSDVPSDASLYPEDDEGNRVPGPNDYIAVGDMSDYPVGAGEDPLSGAWRMTYSGSWDDHWKDGWHPAFQYNESPLTEDQQKALDSRITSQKVKKLDALPTASELTPVAPSTDPSAQGKPADAKATGDALAGKLAKTAAGYTIEETLDGIVITLSGDGAGGEKRYDLTKQGDDSDYTLVRSGELAGKADSADLRYRIAEAGLAASLPTGVTVWLDSEEVTNYAIVSDVGADRWELQVADNVACIWDLDGTNGDPYGAEFKDGGGAALSTPPDLVIFRALADRTVNLVTATDETSIDISLPDPWTGRSRDFYLAVTCGSTPPTLDGLSGVTLVNAKGEPPDLSLTPSATTVLRFTEVKEADTEADPPELAVFCVTGGANGGGSLDLSVLVEEFSEQATYEEGDIVQHNGELYLCESPIETPGQWDGSAWTSASPVISVLLSMIRGKADSSALAAKAESEALAPAWISGHAYFKGDHVSYNGLLYECLSTVAGSTDPSADTTHWKLTDLAAPDATLDILSDGRLRVVAADGTPMWTQGYALASESAVTLSCEKINKYVFAATTATAFSDASTYAVGDRVVYGGKVYKCSTAVETAGAWTGATNWDEDPDTQAFALPNAPSGIVGDFVLDVDNTANEVPVMVAISGTLGTDYDLIVEKGRSSVDVLTIEGGALAELYFTMTAFGTAAKPAWRVVRLNVERQGVRS